jgi:hypothetical protein
VYAGSQRILTARKSSSNPTTSTAKPLVFLVKTRVSRRLWRLIGRLTRYQGSALDDAACASMHVHGRAGKPKQLARNAKNPKKNRVLQRRGQEPNFRVFSQCFESCRENAWKCSGKTQRTTAVDYPTFRPTAEILVSRVSHRLVLATRLIRQSSNTQERL